jgi:hypothetical protein
MFNFFNNPNILGDFDALDAFSEYVKTHSPSQMLLDIRASTVDPNDLPALGDLVKMLLKDIGVKHARVLYTEGVRQLEANPRLKAEDVNLLEAKWNVVACCLDLRDEYIEAFNAINGIPNFVRDYPDMSLLTAMGLWGEGHRQEAGLILEELDAFVRSYGRANLDNKLQEAGLVIEMFDKLKLWVFD